MRTSKANIQKISVGLKNTSVLWNNSALVLPRLDLGKNHGLAWNDFALLRLEDRLRLYGNKHLVRVTEWLWSCLKKQRWASVENRKQTTVACNKILLIHSRFLFHKNFFYLSLPTKPRLHHQRALPFNSNISWFRAFPEKLCLIKYVFYNIKISLFAMKFPFSHNQSP